MYLKLLKKTLKDVFKDVGSASWMLVLMLMYGNEMYVDDVLFVGLLFVG